MLPLQLATFSASLSDSLQLLPRSALLSSPLLSSRFLSSPLLSFPSVCVWLTLSASSSPLSPLSTSLTHCLSLPLITFLSGARGFLISDITAAVQRRSRFTRRSGLTAESSFVPVKCLPSSLPLCSSWAKETFFFFSYPFASCNFPSINPSAVAGNARRWG